MIWTKEQVEEYISKWKEEDIYECKKKQQKTLRTYAMVKYYWAVIVKIIWDFHWMKPIDTNESLKLLFDKETFTDLDIQEFKFVMETIIELWEKDYKVIIPLPSNTWDNESLYKSLWF